MLKIAVTSLKRCQIRQKAGGSNQKGSKTFRKEKMEANGRGIYVESNQHIITDRNNDQNYESNPNFPLIAAAKNFILYEWHSGVVARQMLLSIFILGQEDEEASE